MPEHTIIDLVTYSQLKELMGADFVAELIDTYNIETTTLIEQLGQALSNGDAAAFSRYAHSIKSSSASLGALTFSQQARELEMMGKVNDLSGAKPKMDQLVEDFQRVRQSLEELKNES